MSLDPLRVIDRTRRLLAGPLADAQARERVPVDLEMWQVPDEPVPFAHARQATYTPVHTGIHWGRPWSTVWWKAQIAVPAHWDGALGGIELDVDLGFSAAGPGFQAEALAYDADGRILKAIEPRNTHVRIGAGPGQAVTIYLEAAANPDIARGGDFSPTPLGSKDTAPADPLYQLRHVDLVWRDPEVWNLVQDITTLLGLLDVLPDNRPRYSRVHRALADMLDVLDPSAIAETAAAARDQLTGVLASPAAASAHRAIAVGHAHIDSAWLWPTRETIRKVARTFSNVLDLMDEHPDFVFVASSAQQYAWLKERYPDLFERLRGAVAGGRFIPVGGMWVESDTNMPGSEAMLRQFVEGTRFFREEFGVDTTEVWLPDSFGYSAALPQIAASVGARWLITQKPSWNDTNVLPFHTFLWEGIDGTRLWTHLPPVDTYNADLSIPELDGAEARFAQKAASDVSMVPFGFGDGGGGPTREMLAAADRARDLEGAVRVALGTPSDFFVAAEEQIARPQVWTGEMYLELHRGVLTSQARTKRGNRRSEHLLREAEYWSTVASVRNGVPYPAAEIRAAWHTVLLQQFHDILPGSSIAWVHQEAEANYAAVATSLEAIIASALETVAGPGTIPLLASARSFTMGDAKAWAVTPSQPGEGSSAGGDRPGVSVDHTGDGVVIDNGVIRVGIDSDGLIASAVHLASGRDAIATGHRAAGIRAYRDAPSMWDAWDLEVHYQRVGEDLPATAPVDVTWRDGAVVVTAARTFRDSTVTQRVVVEPGSGAVDLELDIDWHERDTLLKWEFPIAVHADRFASEIQYGHLYRPITQNTSWDRARFETCAHRWIHVEESGFGVGVANDSTYGHDVTRLGSDAHAQGTLMRLSVLRAPQFPDPDADQGQHSLRAALVLGAGVLDMVAHGQRLNLPARPVQGAGSVAPLVTVDDSAAVIEAVKLADDGSGDVIVRIYEAAGGSRDVVLSTDFPWTDAILVNALEEVDGKELAVGAGASPGTVSLSINPFEFRTIRFSRA